MKKKLLLSVFVFVFINSNFAQTASLSFGTQVPLQYQTAINFRPIKQFSSGFGYGILTKPYDGIILDILGKFGTEDELLQIIDCAFEKGKILQGDVNFHFKHNYIKIFGQRIQLDAGTTTTELLEEKSQLDFSVFQLLPLWDPLAINIQSTLFNLGIGYGHSFSINKIEGLSINLEFNFSKTFTSNNTMSSNYESLDKTNKIQNLYQEIDTYLNDEIYTQYVFVPSFNVFLTYTLQGEKQF